MKFLLLALIAVVFATPAVAAVPDIHTPLRTGARAPADAAVVVGIESYLRAPDVPHASRDAGAFYNYLVYTRGIPAARVRLLDQGASREQIETAVAEAGKKVGRDGTVWIYFAGHGGADPSTGERLLLGDDVRQDPASFSARGVAVSALKDLATAGGGGVNLVVDACYSGLGRSGEELVAGRRFLVPAYVTATTGAILEWNAAGPDQLSGPLDVARHGAFTYFAIGALRGWADGHVDGRRDGVVTAEEAQLFVYDALRAVQITDQQPQLAVSDAKRKILAEGRWFETAPALDARFGVTQTAPRPTQPTTPAPDSPPPATPALMDPEDRRVVATWVDTLVRDCVERQMRPDEPRSDWMIRFRVRHQDGATRNVMAMPADYQDDVYPPSVRAVHTCVRQEILTARFSLPRRAVVFEEWVRLSDGTTRPPDAPAPAPTVSPAPAPHVAPAPTPRPAPSAAPAPMSAVPLVIGSADGEWVDVRIDGESVAQLRGSQDRRVTVRPGRHTIELYEFMADEPFYSAVFDTGNDALRVDVRRGDKPSVQGARGWYPDGRGAPALRRGAVPSSVTLILRSLDGTWMDVHVNGRKLAEVRRAGDTRLTLEPGVHEVTFTPFMSSDPWRTGRLDTGSSDLITLGLHESRGVVAYDHDAWSSR